MTFDSEEKLKDYAYHPTQKVKNDEGESVWKIVNKGVKFTKEGEDNKYSYTLFVGKDFSSVLDQKITDNFVNTLEG